MDTALLLNTLLSVIPSSENGKDIEVCYLARPETFLFKFFQHAQDVKAQENGTALHDLFNINALANGSNLADYFSMPSSVKSEEQNDEDCDDDESSHTPQQRPDGLIDSKAMRKATCQICNVKVCSTARQRHVYMVHIKRCKKAADKIKRIRSISADMFACSKCDYTNSNSIWEMRKHCAAQHGQEAAAVSNEEKHKAEIQVTSEDLGISGYAKNRCLRITSFRNGISCASPIGSRRSLHSGGAT